MRPPVPYFGGKQTLAARITEAFPPHAHYVEPFGGSLSVLLSKPPTRCETVNDLDGDLMTFWRVLRDRTDDLARVCYLTPHSRAEHGISDTPATDDLERARRVWVQLTQGRMATRAKSRWRHDQDPGPVNSNMPVRLTGYVARFAQVAERLRNVSLECRPALEIVQRYGRFEDVLLYVDPPYLGSTRAGGNYAVEMSCEDDHRELAEALRDCKASVVLSGYPSALYDELYEGWGQVILDTATGQGGSWASRREVLWCNRAPEGPNLLDLLGEPA